VHQLRLRRMAHDPSSPPKFLVTRNWSPETCPSCIHQTPEHGTRNMASSDDSDDDAVAVAMLLMLEKNSRKQKVKCNVWAQSWILKRPMFGAYHALLQELHASDGQSLCNFLCMDMQSFMLLRDKVAPLISRQDTLTRDSELQKLIAVFWDVLKINRFHLDVYLNRFYSGLAGFCQKVEKTVFFHGKNRTGKNRFLPEYIF